MIRRILLALVSLMLGVLGVLKALALARGKKINRAYANQLGKQRRARARRNGGTCYKEHSGLRVCFGGSGDWARQQGGTTYGNTLYTTVHPRKSRSAASYAALIRHETVHKRPTAMPQLVHTTVETHLRRLLGSQMEAT